jgi:hypothetical protein
VLEIPISWRAHAKGPRTQIQGQFRFWDLDEYAEFPNKMPHSALAGQIGHGLNINADAETPAKSKCPNRASSISRIHDDNGTNWSAAPQQILTSNDARRRQTRQQDDRRVCHLRTVNGRKATRNHKNHHRPQMNARIFHNKFVDSICLAPHCFSSS